MYCTSYYGYHISHRMVLNTQTIKGENSVPLYIFIYILLSFITIIHFSSSFFFFFELMNEDIDMSKTEKKPSLPLSH